MNWRFPKSDEIERQQLSHTHAHTFIQAQKRAERKMRVEIRKNVHVMLICELKLKAMKHAEACDA